LTSFWKKKGRATKWVFLHFVTQNWAWSYDGGDYAIHIYLAPDVRNSSGIVSEIVSPEVSESDVYFFLQEMKKKIAFLLPHGVRFFFIFVDDKRSWTMRLSFIVAAYGQ
jgi:hypothetical protein